MNLFECLRVALRGLASNKMRTALTMLGIIIGVCVVILVVAIGEGATKRVTDAVNSLGTNLLSIWPGASRIRINAATTKSTGSDTSTTTTTAPKSNGPTSRLTLEDAKLIATRFPRHLPRSRGPGHRSPSPAPRRDRRQASLAICPRRGPGCRAGGSRAGHSSCGHPFRSGPLHYSLGW